MLQVGVDGGGGACSFSESRHPSFFKRAPRPYRCMRNHWTTGGPMLLAFRDMKRGSDRVLRLSRPCGLRTPACSTLWGSRSRKRPRLSRSFCARALPPSFPPSCRSFPSSAIVLSLTNHPAAPARKNLGARRWRSRRWPGTCTETAGSGPRTAKCAPLLTGCAPRATCSRSSTLLSRKS
eukprot:3880976-Rhodomonas_salina.1